MPTEEYITCRKCNLPKLDCCFSPDPRKRNGKTSYCKPCHAELVRRRRRTPELRKYDALQMQTYKRRNRIKMQARNAVKTAVIYGRLQKPKNCSKCGGTIKIQAHHHKGYAKEFWLDVEWLCLNCHR